MTDEELGRKWASKYEKRPGWVRRGEGEDVSLSWYEGEGNDSLGDPSDLPEVLSRIDPFLCGVPHGSEGEAFAELGAALRKLVAFADGVREVMG